VWAAEHGTTFLEALLERRRSPGYPISYPTSVVSAENPNNDGRLPTRAAYSKSVSGEIPPTRVRIPPPPLCDVSGHPGHVCRDIVDIVDRRDRLVVAARVER
jgi:hypothetical protein